MSQHQHLLALAVLSVCAVPQTPTVQQVYADMPKQLVAIAERVATGTDLGQGLSIALSADPGSTAGAIDIVHQQLPDWLRGKKYSDLIQASTGEGAAAYWYCLAVLPCADLDRIAQAENQQGSVSEDSGWKDGARSFKLTSDQATARLQQIRAKSGTKVLQSSRYRWGRGGYSGTGIDWLVPIVSKNGTVSAHLLVAIYSHDYDLDNSKGEAPGPTQLKAVRSWINLTREHCK